MKFKDLLKNLNACNSAVEWVGDKTATQAWKDCKRGDWMLWLIDKSKPKITLAMRRKLVMCACEIAETSLECVPKDEKRPAEALKIAMAWASGEKSVTLNMVKDAANAAYAAANAANAAAYAAAYAAYAAANAAAYAAYAAYAAANAAYAAANAANADIVRKYFKTVPKFKK